jgi:hypothetical protein
MDEERIKRQWAIITRRDIPKAHKQMVANHNNQIANAKKFAQVCRLCTAPPCVLPAAV